jgi:hypothetical protein
MAPPFAAIASTCGCVAGHSDAPFSSNAAHRPGPLDSLCGRCLWAGVPWRPMAEAGGLPDAWKRPPCPVLPRPIPPRRRPIPAVAVVATLPSASGWSSPISNSASPNYVPAAGRLAVCGSWGHACRPLLIPPAPPTAGGLKEEGAPCRLLAVEGFETFQNTPSISSAPPPSSCVAAASVATDRRSGSWHGLRGWTHHSRADAGL